MERERQEISLTAPQPNPRPIPPGAGGFVDIHCHMLPDLDDGPRTLETARQMWEVARGSGTVAVIATPHANQRYRYDPEKTAERRARLEAAAGGGLRLVTGSEVELSLETLPEALKAPRAYTLAGSRYLLVELMAGAAPPHLERVWAGLLDQGLTPVIAHPERHPHLQQHPARLAAWVEQGCLAQITADSLTGRMGRRAQATAFDLLRAGLVHFIASDGHDPIQRPPRLLEAYRMICQMLSPPWADLLLIHNPGAVIEDQPIAPWLPQPAGAVVYGNSAR